MNIERKVQDNAWWITSIAISVVCCSILFLLFAGYMVDLKADLRNESVELSELRSSVDNLTARVVTLQKTPGGVPAAATAEVPPPGVDLSAPAAPPVMNAPATPAAPAVTAPTLAPPASTPATAPTAQ